MEATRTTSIRKIVNQEQYCISEGIVSTISATIKNLKDAGCFFLPNPIQLAYLACAESR